MCVSQLNLGQTAQQPAGADICVSFSGLCSMYTYVKPQEGS